MTETPGKHVLKKFDATSLGATKKEWRRQLEAHKKDVLASEWERILAWADGHIEYDQPNSEAFVYGIFEKSGSGHAIAIVEMVFQKSASKWLKLMDLHLCPSVDLSFSTQNVDIQELTSIFGAAVVGTVLLTSTDHPTKTTKLYGRSGTLLAFLKGIGTYIANNANVPGLKVTIEGRWLVFRGK